MSLVTSKLSSRLILMTSSWPCHESLSPVTLFNLPYYWSTVEHQNKYVRLYADYYESTGRPLRVISLPNPKLKDISKIRKGLGLAEENLELMSRILNPEDKIVVHMMSMGATLYALHLYQDERRSVPIFREKIVGQVLDSPAHTNVNIAQVMHATPELVLPHFPLPLRRLFSLSIRGWSILNPNYVPNFSNVLNGLIERPPQVPTLAFYSDVDPSLNVQHFEEVLGKWRGKMELTDVYLQSSLHVQHLRSHPELYRKKVFELLEAVEKEIVRKNERRFVWDELIDET